MLKKAQRLNEDKDFQRVRKKGRTYPHPFFVLGVVPSFDEKAVRFGFVVSKRLDKRAIKRNRVRRLFQEAVADILPLLSPGFDCVIWVRSAAMGKSYEEVSRALNQVLSKVPVLGSGLGKKAIPNG